MVAKKQTSMTSGGLTITLELDKETPGTFRYSAPKVKGNAKKPPIGTLYVSKSAFKGKPPETFTIICPQLS